jgi:hypothetical protein
MVKRVVKETFIKSVLSVTILSVITVISVILFVYQKAWMGFIFILLGLLHILVLRMFGIKANLVWPDIVFGIIDNGILVIAAIIGADFAGILGAVIGGSAANSITDGFAGIFEGWTAQYLRKHKIKEKRTTLSSALGKMAGCLLGAGVAMVILWTVLRL